MWSWADAPSCQPGPISFRSSETFLHSCHSVPGASIASLPLAPLQPAPCACPLLVRRSLPGVALPFPLFHLLVGSHSFLSPGGPAVCTCCVITGKFLNLSEPIFSLVKLLFHFLSTLLCARPGVRHRHSQKDEWTQFLLWSA